MENNNLCDSECTSHCNWDYMQMEFLFNNLRPEDKVVDLGSYRGEFLKFFLQCVKPENITGVEMDQRTFENLKLIFSNFDIKLINRAISNKNELIDYFSGADWACPNIFGHHENVAFNGSKIGKIESSTLDKLFENQQVDVLKMDIEGAELFALEGAVDALKNTRICLVECHNYKEFGDILDILINKMGKDVYCLKHLHKMTLDSPHSWEIVAIDPSYKIENRRLQKI